MAHEEDNGISSSAALPIFPVRLGSTAPKKVWDRGCLSTHFFPTRDVLLRLYMVHGTNTSICRAHQYVQMLFVK